MAWEDTYRDHTLWSAARETLGALAALPADDLTDNVLRLSAVLSEIDGHSDSPHPALTSAHLTTVQATVDSIRTAVPDALASIFAKRGNTSSLFVQLAQYVRTWPATGTTRLYGLSSRAQQVESSFASLNEQLDTRLADVESQVTALATAAASTLEHYKSDLAEQRDAHVALVQEKSDELMRELTRLREDVDDTDATIAKQTERIDAAVTSHQESFTKAQDDRSDKWKAFLDSNEQQLKQHNEQMSEYEEQSRKVLAAVGSNSTATDYGEYANQQAIAANRWRIGAVVALSIAASAFLIAAGLSLFGIGANLDWWQVVLQKLGAPVGAAAVGYVLIRESGQHRKEERSARQVQLTLTALEPFIANLPPDQKKQIRVETARGIFAQQGGASPSGTIVSDSGDKKAAED